MRRHRVLLLTQEAYVGDELTKQINNIFHNRLDIINWCPQDSPTSYNDIDLVISTLRSLRQLALQSGIVSPNVPYVLVHRDISDAAHDDLKRVMQLPEGARVAVCSNSLEGSERIVSYLESIGIAHLELIPYCPNADDVDISGVNTAIIFGVKDTSPPGVSNIIDLQRRVLSDQTIINMIQLGGFGGEISQLANSDNTKAAISLASQLAKVLDSQELISGQLDSVLEHSPSGILITDREYNITQYNNALLAALNLPPERVHPGDRLQDVSTRFYEIVRSINNGRKTSVLWTLKEKDYLISSYALGAGKLQEYQIVILQDVPINKAQPSGQQANVQNFQAKYCFDDIKTRDPNMQKSKQFAMKIAKSDGNVTIYGESGTGKELFAQAIHNYSYRHDWPFVPINVSTLQDSLIESELFGYAEGAFTGSKRGGKAGLFELANNGTIFLDEIGELSYPLQAKLLRVIQEKEIVRVGGTKIIPINVRVISATNQNLYELTKTGKFRQDLYYRLNVLPLELLPLRQRQNDIVPLLEEKLKLCGLSISLLSDTNIQMLRNYSWPGNVRELENVCSFISCLSNLDSEEFDSRLRSYIYRGASDAAKVESSAVTETYTDFGEQSLCMTILADISDSQRHGMPITIKAIYERMHTSAGLSMNSLRRCLRLLESDGLIQIGHTRQGIRITDKGYLSANIG